MWLELFLNAVVAGILLGGFYAAVALGLSITFGQLDIVNIAHPAFVIAGAYATFIINEQFGLDPILIGIMFTPVFFVGGVLLYRFYYYSFERTGQESLTGLALFFGIMFIVEVMLIIWFGVDYRLVEADYIGKTLHLGIFDIPVRMLVPFLVAMASDAWASTSTFPAPSWGVPSSRYRRIVWRCS